MVDSMHGRVSQELGVALLLFYFITLAFLFGPTPLLYFRFPPPRPPHTPTFLSLIFFFIFLFSLLIFPSLL